MARGLSDLQKSILVIVNDQPGGGGYLTDINKQIKSSLFPDTWGKYIRSHGIYLKEHYSWRQGAFFYACLMYLLTSFYNFGHHSILIAPGVRFDI